MEAEAEAEVEAKAETAMDAPEMGARIFISATRSRVPRDSCEKHGARRTSGWPRVAGSDLASCCSGSPLRGKSGRGRRSRRRLSRHPRPRSACTQHRSPVSRTDCSPPLARWRARPPPCAASPIRTPWKASRLREVPASAPARVSMCAESVLSWGGDRLSISTNVRPRSRSVRTAVLCPRVIWAFSIFGQYERATVAERLDTRNEVAETEILYDRKSTIIQFDSLVTEIRNCAIKGWRGFLGHGDFDQKTPFTGVLSFIRGIYFGAFGQKARGPKNPRAQKRPCHSSRS